MSKPYKFIKILPYAPFNYGNKEKFSGKIKLKITVKTPLHISSGRITEKNGKLYKDFIKYNGIPIIPGTSLKGCVRAIAEAVSNSCANVDDKNRLEVCKIDDKNDCIICQTFGYASDEKARKSRVIFSDFKMKNLKLEYINFPRFFTPRENCYLKNNKYKGYKFYYNCDEQEKGFVGVEVAPRGSEFEGEIIYNDLTQEQLNLLCFSLGLSGDIYLKLGYGKPAYYGTVEVTAIDDGGKYSNYARDYENISSNDIKQNIKSLKEIYGKDKMLKNSQWKLVGKTKSY
ncbi:RAMP superfamily CRISPR-associated protein [Thermobrachium celere]|uniref:RAMP superfamily CRISPR-associated protein n=1 Tax=Thermobrachium celere TaxID=53422 RepID=UPI0019426774|nr:RAMP superfamily CRISPR-associated protein [Thermobrachium celere]GFR35910.1 hypothetical protein TCEA9_17220 [Thermobrachium celere]